MAVFVVACVLCVPVVFLTMASGALFGLTWGFVYAWGAAQVGAALSFLVGRHLARDWVQRSVRKRRMLAALETAVSSQGWRVVVLARLAPGSPFFLLNYVFGVTRIGFLPYCLATSVSIIPGTLMFVYLGSLGQQAASGGLAGTWQTVLHGVGVVAVLVASYTIGRTARRALKEMESPNPGTEAGPAEPISRSGAEGRSGK